MLAAPRDTDFVASGGGGSQLDSESTGYLYSHADLQSIASHYGWQFETAGWTLESEEQDAVAARSRWTRHDEEGDPVEALFLAVRYPGAGRCFLLARASRSVGAAR